MPFLLALVASATFHVSLLLSDGWALPSMSAADEIDVVLPPPHALKAPLPVRRTVPPTRPAAAMATPATPVADAPVRSPGVEIEPSGLPAAAPPAQRGEVVPAEEPLPAALAMPPAVLPVPIVAAALARLPARASWRYTVTRGEGGLLIGQAIYDWQRDERQYAASSRTETIGLAALFVSASVTQESAGELDETGLHPARYRHVQPKRTDTAELNREQGLVRNNARDTPLGDAAGRVQDLLSLYFQLGLLLQSMELLPDEIELPLVTGRKLESYRFAVVGEETLTYRLESYRTRHLRARNGPDTIDLWFAADHVVPLRMRIADRKGDVYEQWLATSE